MTAKRATVRLYVALTGLFASLLEFTGALVRLCTAYMEKMKHRVQAGTGHAPVTASAPPSRIATVAMTEDERLVSALMSLGFRAANVRAFAASVCGRQVPLEVLVKEGIVVLSAN